MSVCEGGGLAEAGGRSAVSDGGLGEGAAGVEREGGGSDDSVVDVMTAAGASPVGVADATSSMSSLAFPLSFLGKEGAGLVQRNQELDFLGLVRRDRGVPSGEFAVDVSAEAFRGGGVVGRDELPGRLAEFGARCPELYSKLSSACRFRSFDGPGAIW